jgi:hypothetical protein
LSRRSNCDSKLLTRRYKSLSELSCWQINRSLTDLYQISNST